MSNVGPSDRDYPQLNPRPGRVIEMRVSAPPTLVIRFYAYYSTSLHQGDCQYAVNALEGANAPFSVTDPIELRVEGDQKIAAVEIDGNTRIWDGAHKILLQEIPADLPVGYEVGAVAVSRDSRYLAIAKVSEISIWKLH